MTLPFTAPEFFRLFARYNLAVWPAQIALIGLAIAVLALVFARPLRSVRAIPALLALLWAWSGVTFGVLAFLRPPYRPYVFVAPLLWAAVGTLGALLFGIHEDLGLAAAGLAGALFALYPARRA